MPGIDHDRLKPGRGDVTSAGGAGAAAPAAAGGGAAVSAGAFDGTSISTRVMLSAVVWTTRGVPARAFSTTATVVG